MEITEQISLFNDLFYVCLGIAAVGAILAVFFFFFFDIPTIFYLKIGKARKKPPKKTTGPSANSMELPKLHYATDELYPSGDITPPTEEPQTDILRQGGWSAPPGGGQQEPPLEESEAEGLTAILPKKPPAGSKGTFELVEETVLVHTNELI